MRPRPIHVCLCGTLAFTNIHGGQVKAAGKTWLEAAEITAVELRTRDEKTAAVRLFPDEIAEFARQWNKARGVGLCKFYPQLWITVSDANGGAREFRLNGHTLKEGDDRCYRLDKTYSEGLLNKILR